jgi:predicted TIM-barrel fold metal-dependent hydrolase
MGTASNTIFVDPQSPSSFLPPASSTEASADRPLRRHLPRNATGFFMRRHLIRDHGLDDNSAARPSHAADPDSQGVPLERHAPDTEGESWPIAAPAALPSESTRRRGTTHMSYHLSFHNRILRHYEETAALPAIDAHLHFVDFVQETDGMHRLIACMDKSNIRKSVVFGIPVIKKWDYFEPKRPRYYLDDETKCYYFSATDFILAREYETLADEARRRIAPLLCGFNPTDRNAIDYVERMFDQFPFWRGIGELLLRHDDLTHLTQEEVARINHPACFPLYEFCAGKNVPVLVHQNSSSIGDDEGFLYLPEFEHVLKNFPSTQFVWAHCGISRRIYHDRYPEVLDALLRKYKNLSADISWIIYDEVICNGSAKHTPRKEWVDLIRKFPDRFLIGTDLCGRFDVMGKAVSRYNSLFRALARNSESAHRIAYANANDLFFE